VIEPTATLFSEVLAGLASRNPDRRWHAAEEIRELGSEAVQRAARPLLACLEDESRRVRVAAVWALLGASPLPDEAVPVLMECLLSKSSEMRAWCCTLLGEVGTNRQGVRVALELLAEHDPDENVRWRAGASLRETAEVEARVHSPGLASRAESPVESLIVLGDGRWEMPGTVVTRSFCRHNS